MIADAVIGGLQEHQTPRTDGICPSLTAAMGMGGGQIPLIVEIIEKNSNIKGKDYGSKNNRIHGLDNG